MILDIDAGNTRLKWVLHNGDIDVPMDRGWVANTDLAAWLDERKWQGLEEVRLASVAGATTDLLCRWANSHEVRFKVAMVVDGAAGVRCAYRDPARLGVDRWLALLAARQHCSEPCLVIDAGTALTVDLLGRDGVHEGGYIAPGLALMAKALGSNTWGVRVESTQQDNLLPGVDTAQAVGHGCLAAAVGMVAGVARSRGVLTLLLTGGDAQLLAEHLKQWCEGASVCVVENLVLKGLDIALSLEGSLAGNQEFRSI